MTDEQIINALKWFIEQDDTWDIESNGYWVLGLERARKAVAVTEKVGYIPLEWENQSNEVMREISKMEQGKSYA